MDRNYQEYFERFDIDPDIFERVALTPEQIEEYNIPTRQVKTKPQEGKKQTDSRAMGFKARGQLI